MVKYGLVEVSMLKYVGNGTSLQGIPARDLTEEEVKQFGRDFLLASGLYETVYTVKPTKSATKKTDEMKGEYQEE